MKDEIKEILEDLLFVTTLPNVSIKLSEEKLIQLKDYITNLQKENKVYKSRIEKAIEYIQHELSHLKANDEETWNEEFYTNNKLDYRKLCIALLEQVENKLQGVDNNEN